MFLIDQLATQNGMRQVPPLEKFIFAMVTLLITLMSPTFIVSILTLTTMSLLVMGRAKISWRVYLGLLTLPLVFLLIGMIPILLQIGKVLPSESLPLLQVRGFQIYTTVTLLYHSLFLLLRSLGCVSCLYFLLLTTPMVQIQAVLGKLKVPILFQELMLLIYRFIFVLMETAQRIYRAQQGRGGYGTWRNGLNSFAQLVTMVFLKANHRGEKAYTALMSRGYTGTLQVVTAVESNVQSMWLQMVGIELMLITVSLWRGM